MAVASVNYTIVDGTGRKSSVTVYLPNDLVIGDIQDFSDLMAPIIEDLIDGAITGVTVAIGLTLPVGLNATPGANSDVEEGARFIFASVNGYSTAVRIPTFKEALISPNSKAVDQTEAAVIAFVDAMVDGLAAGLGTAEPTDYRGDDIVGLTSANESFQRTRK